MVVYPIILWQDKKEASSTMFCYLCCQSVFTALKSNQSFSPLSFCFSLLVSKAPQVQIFKDCIINNSHQWVPINISQFGSSTKSVSTIGLCRESLWNRRLTYSIENRISLHKTASGFPSNSTLKNGIALLSVSFFYL